jgi:hypothetical protein
MDEFVKLLLTDLKIELMDEFDRNFERKAFFDRPWPEVARANKRGSLMMRSGALRRGNRAKVAGLSIVFSNSMPYARIQNEGGTIVVTRKMQKFFWAMYYSLAGRQTFSVKTKAVNGSKKNQALSNEAGYWKAMALKKVGSKIIIPERRFIGHHIEVDHAVKRVADSHFKQLETEIYNLLKPHS